MKKSVRDYAQALYQLVSDQPGKRKVLVADFVALLEKERNRSLLPLIVEELEKIEAEAHSLVMVTVTTATNLSSTQSQHIKNQLKAKFPEAKGIELQEIVEPSLLGGIRIQIDDQVIDHTTQTKLNQLAARL